MKKRNLLLLILPMIAFILELLPGGSILLFGGPDESGAIVTKKVPAAYISKLSLGYANVGPVLTAVLTVVLLLLLVVFCITRRSGMLKGLLCLTAVAVPVSLLPLFMDGLDRFTVIGFLIPLTLAAEFCFMAFHVNRIGKTENLQGQSENEISEDDFI